MADVGITASVGSVADAYDNAMAESVISTPKKELDYRRTFRTREDVEFAIVEWINWYNERRLHSSIGDQPPKEYEDRWYRQNESVDSDELQPVRPL